QTVYFARVSREIIGEFSDCNRYSGPRIWYRSPTGTLPASFRGKNPYSYFFSLSSLVGISAFYVTFKYYHAPVGAQLNRNTTSILRQMQTEHRDKEPTERHAQERKGCGQGRLPQLRNLSLPNRKRVAIPSLRVSFFPPFPQDFLSGQEHLSLNG